MWIYRDLPSCLLPEFKYTSEDTLDGMMVTGQLDSYSGGGYVFNLKGANKDLRFDLMFLHGLLLTRLNQNVSV